jgi:hypothetical protein
LKCGEIGGGPLVPVSRALGNGIAVAEKGGLPFCFFLDCPVKTYPSLHLPVGSLPHKHYGSETLNSLGCNPLKILRVALFPSSAVSKFWQFVGRELL